MPAESAMFLLSHFPASFQNDSFHAGYYGLRKPLRSFTPKSILSYCQRPRHSREQLDLAIQPSPDHFPKWTGDLLRARGEHDRSGDCRQRSCVMRA